ncbi:MAG: glycosyltransferase family 4 protein [Methylobacteriaceae bacterium]|nr:glycosyltransferase family 4 protein [Methylobacteriaceae bacterium]
MQPGTAYDITRLVTRVLNVTPNGIDRIDFALARHFLGKPDAAGMMATSLGPRVLSGEKARAAVEAIGAHWREEAEPEHEPAYLRVRAELLGREAPPAKRATAHVAQGRSGRVLGALHALGAYGMAVGRSPRSALAKGARYVNVSQFPLWVPSYFRWLEDRRDVKAVFFIHDVLPIEMPEYFREAEYERFRARLANLARFGTAALVTTTVVRAGLEEQLRALGRTDFPICVAPIPVAPIFSTAPRPDPALAHVPYFVVCSTIEPRKNHLLLLQVWRELVRRDGPGAPKLVIIGGRGWKFEAVATLLDRSPLLRGHVVEVSGLATPSLKRLLDGARALLMPSFAEGYGLPVVEALTAGVPVIASDIPVFQEIAGGRATLISPLDGEAWLETIRALGQTNATTGRAPVSAAGPGSWDDYFAKIDAFVNAL